MNLFEATEILIQNIKNPSTTEDDYNEDTASFINAVHEATESDFRKNLDTFSDLFFLENEDKSGYAMILCGSLIEDGYDLSFISFKITEKINQLLKRVEPFYQTCKVELERNSSQIDDDDENEDFDIEQLKEGLSHEMPDAINAWDALELQYPAYVAFYGMDKKERQKAKKSLSMLSEIATMNEGCNWLNTMLQVLEDDPILVIDIEEKVGFMGKISGIVDNFQLHTLLMDKVPQIGFFKRKRVPQKVVDIARGIGEQMSETQVTGYWNLYNWTAISEALSLPDPTDYSNSKFWIWGEGTPTDIATLHGFRVILLGKSSYERSWKSQRIFASLKADITIEKELKKDEIAHWLSIMLNEKKQMLDRN
jgi:hypothetical protein